MVRLLILLTTLSYPLFGFTIKGKVIDGITKAPIVGAIIEFDGPRTTAAFHKFFVHTEVTTDANGYYSSTYTGDGGLDNVIQVVATRRGIYRPSAPSKASINNGSEVEINFSLTKEVWIVKELGNTLTNPDIFYRTIPNSGVCKNPLKPAGLTDWAVEDCNYSKWLAGRIFDAGVSNYVPFVWTNSGLVKIPGFDGQILAGLATAINDHNVAVGSTDHTPPGVPARYRAFRWINGKTQKLGELPGMAVSSANDINERNEIVGQVYFNGGIKSQMVVWDAKGLPTALLPGSVIPTNAHSYSAKVIDNSGRIAGSLSVRPPGRTDGSSETHMLYWNEKRELRDAGMLPGHFATSPFQINNRGEVVGSSLGEALREELAFIYSEKTGFMDLNHVIDADYPYILEEAWSINDRREIVGITWKRTATGWTKVPFYMRQMCPGDLNDDRKVDALDFVKFRENYGREGVVLTQDGDLNGDNKISYHDYNILKPYMGVHYDDLCNSIRPEIPMPIPTLLPI